VRAVAIGLAVVILGLLALQVREAKSSADRRIGITIDTSVDEIRIATVVPDLPAARAGVRPGDVIEAVNGVPTPDWDAYQQAAAGFRRDQPVPVSLQRAGVPEPLAVEVSPGAAFPWYDTLVNGLAAVGYLLIGILGLFGSGVRGDRRAQLLALFSAAVAIELAMPGTLIGAPLLSVIFSSAYLLLTGAQIGLDLHLASIIPERPEWLRRHRWVVPAYYAVGGGIGIVVFTSFLAAHLGRQPFPWTGGQAQAWLQRYVLPTWALLVPALLLRAATRHQEPAGRQQAALVLTGVLPWSAFILITSALGWAGVAVPAWVSGLQPLILLCYPIAVFVAIFRYHLFDLELVVRRSLVYTALTAVLVGIFFLVLWVAGVFFAQWVEGGRGSIWIVSGVTLLLGLLFSPLRRSLQRAIDRRFFPERHAMRQRLAALAGELPALGSVPLMGQHLVLRLIEIFGLRNATLLLAEPRNGVFLSVASIQAENPNQGEPSILLGPDEHGSSLLLQARHPLLARHLVARAPELAGRLALVGAELVVPLVSQERLVGALLLGEKQERLRQEFTAEELELLDLVAHHAAIVFENARLFESATYESLTGLLRREAVMDVLERELHRAARHRRPLTIGMADLDHFKEVNDRHGHLTGDRLLKRVAQAIAKGLRGTDAVGRYGGEEFLLVLPETDMEGAMAVAEKVRHLVSQESVVTDDGGRASVTLSVGLATLTPEGESDQRTARYLIAEADRALYRAKRTGRNRVETPLAAG
jgi:diguanylate cyclase (GGDEF)-like protein